MSAFSPRLTWTDDLARVLLSINIANAAGIPTEEYRRGYNDACRAIAIAYGIPPEHVLVTALPTQPQLQRGKP